ncbi:hypothetical protein Poli38472_008471 [Pythium oligandrum]|uniref:Timeless N-terminal domain-containing protein n=1 Tax=Pythium oligandrum TaxID=41045 RepID=A0A8K1C3T2_PYTOL|nr:hypothetical protein Poli38472_008471 [Pythium oligandrum]|eukprot:TMW55823.1 hypothetical protein Poli38472_008471 [Pythium oligandrum]
MATSMAMDAVRRIGSDGEEAEEVNHVVRENELEDFSMSEEDEAADAGKAALDAAMMNELLLVCSNLGMLRVENEGEAPVLMRGEDCEEWVHDLQRAIRRDHAKHKLVVKQLGKWKILQKKLLPLLVNHQHDWSLVFSILKVLVMLTMKPPRDSANIAQQLKYLRDYKHAFLREGVIPILMTILVDPLSKKGSSRTPEDYLIMELVLTLIRNLLAIPNEDARFVTSSTSHFSRLQEDLICTLHQENVYEMILLFAQDIDSAENREWNLLIMEMMDLTLTTSHPKALVSLMKQAPQPVQEQDGTQTSTTVRPPPRDSLVSQLSREKKLLQPQKAQASKRHSNFGGMMKLVGSTGRSTVLTSFSKIGDDQVPQAAKKPISRKRGGRSSQPPVTQTMDVIEIFAPKQTVSDGDFGTLSVLKDICDVTLEKSYFQLTNSLKGEFRRGSSKLVSTDRLQYFHLVWYLTTYHRLKMQAQRSDYRHQMKAYEKQKKAQLEALDFESLPPPEPTKPDYNAKAVLSSLDMFSFNFVLQSIETYAGVKNYHGMAVSVKLLAEMMMYLSELANSDDQRFQRIADSLQHKIFYERDFLDRLPVLLKTWSPGQFSMEYVVDVITLTHIVFKILDAQGTIKVLSRRKAALDEKRKQQQLKKKKDGQDGDDEGNDESDEEEEAERQAQLLVEMQRKEADFDVRRYFQSILSFETIKMYCHVLQHYRTNSPKVNHYIHSFFYRAKHFKIHKDEEWTMQPMLFNIHVLMIFNRMLQDSQIQRQSEFRGFLDFIRGVVRDFFELAEKNRLLFVETLLRQPFAARSCQLIQRIYEPTDSQAKSRAEAVALGRQERLDRISEARRQKRAMDAEELEGEEEFEFTLNASDFQASSLVQSSQQKDKDGSDDEDAAELNSAASASAKSAETSGGARPRRSKAAVDRAKNWTKVEDRFLKKVYLQYRHLPSVYEVISYEDMFQDRDRTPEQIERRVKHLKLHRLTHDSVSEDEDGNEEDANADDADEDDEDGDNRKPTADPSTEYRLPKGLESDESDPEEGLQRANKRLRRRLRRGALSDEDDGGSDGSDDDLLSGSSRHPSKAKQVDEPMKEDTEMEEMNAGSVENSSSTGAPDEGGIEETQPFESEEQGIEETQPFESEEQTASSATQESDGESERKRRREGDNDAEMHDEEEELQETEPIATPPRKKHISNAGTPSLMDFNSVMDSINE